jgi:hypothetical protein
LNGAHLVFDAVAATGGCFTNHLGESIAYTLTVFVIGRAKQYYELRSAATCNDISTSESVA